MKSSYITMGIVAVIAVLMAGLITLINYNFNQIVHDTDALIFRENSSPNISEDLKKGMEDYKLEKFPMLEIYDESFNQLLRLPLDQNNHKLVKYDSMKEQKDLQDIFMTYQEGYTKMNIDGHDEDIYFSWATTDKGNRELIIVYLSRPVIKMMWAIPFICYLILLLIFVIIIRLKLSIRRAKIDLYNRSSQSVQNAIRDWR